MVEWGVWQSTFSCESREGGKKKKERELLETEYKLKGSSFKKAKQAQKDPEMKAGAMAAEHSSEPVQCE